MMIEEFPAGKVSLSDIIKGEGPSAKNKRKLRGAKPANMTSIEVLARESHTGSSPNQGTKTVGFKPPCSPKQTPGLAMSRHQRKSGGSLSPRLRGHPVAPERISLASNYGKQNGVCEGMDDGQECDQTSVEKSKMAESNFSSQEFPSADTNTTTVTSSSHYMIRSSKISADGATVSTKRVVGGVSKTRKSSDKKGVHVTIDPQTTVLDSVRLVDNNREISRSALSDVSDCNQQPKTRVVEWSADVLSEGNRTEWSPASSLPESSTAEMMLSGTDVVKSLREDDLKGLSTLLFSKSQDEHTELFLRRGLSLNTGSSGSSRERVRESWNGTSAGMRLNRAQTFGLEKQKQFESEDGQRYSLAKAIPRIAGLVLSQQLGSVNRILDDNVEASSTVRNIVYLEPCPSSRLFMRIEKFWRWTIENHGRNEAHMYRPHISATGFFDVPNTSRHASESLVIDQLAARMDQLSAKDREDGLPRRPPQPKVLGLCRSTATTLVLSVSTPQAYLDMLNSLSLLPFNIRPKVADHISLAYANKYVNIDGERFNSAIVDNLEVKAREMITCTSGTCLGKEDTPGACLTGEDVQWDLVVYRVACSADIDQPHEFTQLKRWRIT